jgi:hypothetical protein
MSRLFYDGKRSANLMGFVDVDWARDFDSRRSTSKHCFIVVGVVMSWSNKRQNSTSLSSTNVVWLRKLLGELNYQ